MKKFYSLILILAICGSAMAQSFVKPSRPQQAPRQTKQGLVVQTQILVPYLFGAYYTKKSDNLAEFYLVMSSVSGDYNSSTGEFYAPDGKILFLSLYAAPNAGAGIPLGTYKKGDGTEPFTYNAQDTYIQVCDENSQGIDWIDIEEDIVVTQPTNGQYIIETKANVDGKVKTVRYRGSISFNNTEQTTDLYHQIVHNVETTFTGAKGWYYGNLYDSNTGNMELRLYDCQFDPEDGAMMGDGYAIKLSLFGPLFTNSAEAEVAPGHYTVARNFMRNTWFPGMEINYIGMVVPFGTYLQEHRDDPDFGDNGYGWAYITNGTIDIEDIGDGKLRITLDLVSKTGYTIKGTYEGEIPVEDVSDDDRGAVVSTLTQDLELSLDYIPMAHAFNKGVQYDTRAISVDIGFDGSPDPNLCDQFVEDEFFTNSYGADVLRMEFLVKPEEGYLPDGVYQVMEQNYSNFYAPGRMRKGYFEQGGITGTRWVHFAPNRYYIMDGHAPADLGSVSVERSGDTDKEGNEIYTFIINLIDDAGFNITGAWRGPLELRYDPSEINGIHGITAEGHQRGALYDAQGRMIHNNMNKQAGLYFQAGQKMLQK